MDDATRSEIMGRYRVHARLFDQAAQRRQRHHGDTLPATPPELRECARLSAREVTVLQLIADGLTDREIGQALYLSEFTVKSHVKRLFGKLSARNRANAVAIAASHRLVSLGL